MMKVKKNKKKTTTKTERKLHTYFTLTGLKGLHSFIHLKKKKIGKLAFDLSFKLPKLVLVMYFDYNIIISNV